MSFTLQVDAVRWRAGTDSVRDALRAAVRGGSADPQLGDVVPVVKGNGYGLGNERLARESVRLGVAAVAVGSVHELDAVLAAYPGDVLVLTPYEPADVTAAAAWQTALGAPAGGRVIRTLAAATALHAAIATAGPGRPVRAVLEGLTSTGRFGVAPAGLRAMLAGPEVRGALDDGALRIEGLALHLPLAQPATDHRAVPGAAWHDATVDPAWPAGTTGRVREVLAWQRGWQQLLGDVQAGGDGGADVPGGRRTALAAAPALWLSHLSDAELAVVRGAVPGVPLQVRVGTRLWLGDRQALVPQGTVLAVHELQRGDRSGYRQRRSARDGALVVVSGGTAHGVALQAPTPAASVRQRVVAAGTGVLEAGGRSLSPFSVGGRQRWFAEPPHMQVSLVRLPAGVPVPAVGDLLPCAVRLTTATFDRVLGLD